MKDRPIHPAPASPRRSSTSVPKWEQRERPEKERPRRPKPFLSHYGADGAPHMVDVSAKPETLRQAEARALVALSARVRRGLATNPKGSPLEIARFAGIAAAKRTADLIPLCHPLSLTAVDVRVRPVRAGIEITSRVATRAATGVEMEALTAVGVAALTVYDMCKSQDRGIEIREIMLLRKRGGKSGEYLRKPARPRRG